MAYSMNWPIAILDRGIDPASTATRHVEILLLPMAEEQERGLEAVAAGDFPSFCFHFIACPLPSSVLQVNCTMDEGAAEGCAAVIGSLAVTGQAHYEADWTAERRPAAPRAMAAWLPTRSVKHGTYKNIVPLPTQPTCSFSSVISSFC